MQLGLGVNDVYKATMIVVGAFGMVGWDMSDFLFLIPYFLFVWIINNGNDNTSSKQHPHWLFLLVLLFQMVIQSGLSLRMVIGASWLWKNLDSRIVATQVVYFGKQ